MTDERMIRALRAMAWERAKGELGSMLHTYYAHDKHGKPQPCYFDQFKRALKSFVKQVEDNGWQE